MEIMDIIKSAFIFPSQNLEKLAIYIALSFVVGILFLGGVLTGVLGIANNAVFIVFAVILFILAIVVGLLLGGYQVNLIKSGIDQTEEAPNFGWKSDVVTGLKWLIVSIVYFIIPAIVVVIVGFITNVPGQVMKIIQEFAAASASVNATANTTASMPVTISNAAISSLVSSLALTGLVALILFIIFTFLKTMGDARLANTGSLGEALNIVEAFKDISRIGFGKVIAVILLSFIIVTVINGILSIFYARVPFLSILSIIVSPYLMFFTQRVTGLLYSDIA